MLLHGDFRDDTVDLHLTGGGVVKPDTGVRSCVEVNIRDVCHRPLTFDVHLWYHGVDLETGVSREIDLHTDETELLTVYDRRMCPIL